MTLREMLTHLETECFTDAFYSAAVASQSALSNKDKRTLLQSIAKYKTQTC